MPIEPITAVMIYKLAASNAPAAVDLLRDYAVGKLGDAVVGPIWRGALKVLRPGYKSERELQREDIESLKRVIDAIETRVSALGVAFCTPTDDRATDDFVATALQSAFESNSTAKQDLLGQLIGQRLYTETESSDDLFLREALGIAGRANQTQLFALGALYLVHEPPETHMDPESLVRWWDAEYMPLLKQFVGTGWGEDDLDYLERLGAVRRDRNVQGLSVRSGANHGPVINNVLGRRSLSPADSVHARTATHSEFAIYCARLHAGTAKTTAWPSLPFALEPFALTVPGGRVARTLIDSLTEKSIEEAARFTTYPYPKD